MPATQTLSFRDKPLPSGHQSSGYQLNLMQGSANFEGFGSTSTSKANRAFNKNKMTATQRNQFTELVANTIKLTKEQPVSTFSIDVDTASYGFCAPY